MAKRIATKYVHTRFQLNSSELQSFIGFMKEQQLSLQVLILDHGSQSLRLEDVAGQESITMTFERHDDHYVCEMSCTIVQHKLTDVMRKAVSIFRGDAIVNRIYSNYIMQYHYRDGSIMLIVEVRDQENTIVFQKKNRLQQLQHVFDSISVEREIEVINDHIDKLLDRRNATGSENEQSSIDAELEALTKRLFQLEAN